MRFSAAFTFAGVYACLLLLPGLLTACSTASQDSQGKDTLIVTAGAKDEPTARANAMETGQHLCLSKGGRQASMMDMETTPPPVVAMNEAPNASSTTDALEASNTEGDIWRAKLTLRCH